MLQGIIICKKINNFIYNRIKLLQYPSNLILSYSLQQKICKFYEINVNTNKNTMVFLFIVLKAVKLVKIKIGDFADLMKTINFRIIKDRYFIIFKFFDTVKHLLIRIITIFIPSDLNTIVYTLIIIE